VTYAHDNSVYLEMTNGASRDAVMLPLTPTIARAIAARLEDWAKDRA
jgi:hypothetical protein